METRERLIEATIQLLGHRGYARTTTREIVAEADAHLPAVNYFFGSKDRLLHEAVTEALRRWCTSTMEVVADLPASASATERLEVSLQRFFSTLERDRSDVVAALEAFAQAERSEELRDALAGAYRQFRELLARSVADTAGAPDAATDSTVIAVATVLIALFDGLAIQWLLDPAAAPTAESVMTGLGGLAAARAAPADGE